MAEVVGVVVGVVSLGVQLAESLQKVKRFYNTVIDAPERLADIIDEIASLSDILTELEEDPTSNGANTGPNMQRCVAACRKAVDRFSTYANSLESRMKRCKGRGSVKFAMKNESIESVIASLESSKSNLVLAYMLYREAIAEKRARLVHEQMEIFASGQALLLRQREAPQDAQMTSDKRPEVQLHRRSNMRSLRILKTPLWLSRNVWELAIYRAISGWTFSIRGYSMLPLDSPLLKICSSGDIARLQRSFDLREASPFDSFGFSPYLNTLLDIAVSFNQMEVARLLVRCGMTSLHAQALVTAIMHLPPEFLTKDTVDAQRNWILFLAENCEIDWDTYKRVHTIARLQVFLYGGTEESSAAFFWIYVDRYRSLQTSPFNLGILILNDDTSYLLNYGDLNYTDNVNILAQAYVTNATRDISYSASNMRILGELVAGAIDLGHDLHEGTDGISPLLRILHAKYEVLPAKDLEARLVAWLSLLKSIGVDLCVYGREEWSRFQALRRDCERPWDWWHGVGAHWCEEVNAIPQHRDFAPTLTAFTYGEEVSDWKIWMLHHGDQYAGQFWRLIEQNGIYNRHVPGGWVEDE